MYSFVVMNILILEITLPSIKCFKADLSNYNPNNSRRFIFPPRLFDHAEFPADGVIPMLNRKVFKGRRVSIREHPYVASIRRNVAHYSVGSILTKNMVLTVAYPLINVSIAELSVVVGENYADRGSMLLTVILIIVHEDFNPSTLQNDIAMLRTFEDITYKGSAKSIPLIPATESLNGRKAFVTGWGRCDRTGKELCLPRSTRYTPGEKLDPMLRTVSFQMEENNHYCTMYQGSDMSLPPGMLCVGLAREENPVAPCLAVPGAPLAVKARLTGILSWGFGCCHYKDLPLIYTNAQYYQPWIVHNIRVFRNISKVYLLKLFQAKRAYILREWLSLTRVVPPDPYVKTDKHMTALRVDRDLAKLSGNVYDIRDYLENGAHHKYKVKLYAKFRNASLIDADYDLKHQKIQMWFKKRNESLKPFIKEVGDETDVDIRLSETDDGLEDDDSNEEYV